MPARQRYKRGTVELITKTGKKHGPNNDDEPLSLGIDLGSTKVEASLVDTEGRIIYSHRNPTQPEKGPDKVIADIVDCVRNCLAGAGKPAEIAGVGVAGQIEKGTGIVRFAPNLGWHNVPLKERLEKELNLPVLITNDVRAATYGEWQRGSGRGSDDLVCVFIGTGIGGGVVTEGRLLEGSSNTAGELGHMTVVTNGRKCHCGNHGCLEAYAGGWAIGERAREEITSDPELGEPLIKLAGSIGQVSALTVTQAYISGTPLGRRIVQETANYLAAGLVGIVNAFNPSLLVLGGGVIEGLPDYLSAAEPILRRSALEAAVEEVRITTAGLGNKAGTIGAAELARHFLLRTGYGDQN